jgi:hypothetical protein
MVQQDIYVACFEVQILGIIMAKNFQQCTTSSSISQLQRAETEWWMQGENKDKGQTSWCIHNYTSRFSLGAGIYCIEYMYTACTLEIHSFLPYCLLPGNSVTTGSPASLIQSWAPRNNKTSRCCSTLASE